MTDELSDEELRATLAAYAAEVKTEDYEHLPDHEQRRFKALHHMFTRLLEILPMADDAESLTDDWLNGVNGDGWHHRGYAIEIGPLEFEPHAYEAGGAVTLHPERLHVKRLTTRGDVRRLCAAIGITLQEPRQ